jgi:uncharacterized protein (TIGR01244 family)
MMISNSVVDPAGKQYGRSPGTLRIGREFHRGRAFYGHVTRMGCVLGCLTVGMLTGCAGELAAPPSSTGGTAEAGTVNAATVTATPIEVGSTKNVFQIGNWILAGQPGAEDFETIKSLGVSTVISIRGETEIEWDERTPVEAAGLKFVQLPMTLPTEMSAEKLDQIREVIKEAKANDSLVMLHCGVAVRASAVWMACECAEGMDWETAESVVATQVRLPQSWKDQAKSYVDERSGL